MKNRLATLVGALALSAAASAQTWIWYPGDYEIWLGNQMNNRRTERGAFFPPFWKTDSHYVVVEFSKKLDLAEPEEIFIAAEGKYNVKLDGKLQFGMPSTLKLPAGKHSLNIKVWNQSTPPTIYVKGKTVNTDKTWKVTYEDNPLKNLIFGGRLSGDNLVYTGTRRGHYAGTEYLAWMYKSKKPVYKQSVHIALNTEQGTVPAWEASLARTEKEINVSKDKQATRRWWNDFWKRSFIEGEGEAGDAIRNYTLFRYMLGCNAYSQWPTKFNGGLFTFDPMYVDQKMEFTPDFRKWGGGTMTAQNQRLVYWPMLKSGDFDLMKSQFDFYLRLLPTAEARTRAYWGHAGACFTEQMENFGLPNPAEYGFKRPASFDKGLEYNAWLEYEWDTVLEFCQMILETARYDSLDISCYTPLIESSLSFFDEHYRQLALQRGRKDLDGSGKLVIYPGSACETYKMAYNPSSTIAALRSVLQTYRRKPYMLARIPEIPLRIVDGKEMIAPAQVWERVNNIETPQLYPVFPWRIYGVGREGLEIARNTYLYDPDAQKFRSHTGWKQDNIWAACLGMTEEAAQLTLEKMANGPHRFPAFWGPGYDWTPDHNWGGSGMIGMQEMLLQEADGKILLFPAWPKDWNVHFKLHATGQTTVEATLKEGAVVSLTVQPKEREKDVVNCLLNK